MTEQREKVVVAMSGGVDSSVAVCLLQEQGYDVLGLFMRVGVTAPEVQMDTAAAARVGAVSKTARAVSTESNAVSQKDDAFSSPLTKGGSRGVPRANKNLPQPLLGKEGSKKSNDLRGNNASGTTAATQPARRLKQGCCSASDADDARFVAGMLGVPFYVLNFQDDFAEIMDYFAGEYVRGRTPNPCVVCNDRLKFGKLLDYADAVGAKYVATGHYARIGERNGRKTLRRGRDADKDQSYVLFGLRREVLDRVLFPVGDLTKPQVRAVAGRLNLPNDQKPDSVEICFVPDNDYARVVRERRPDAFAEGDVVNQDGTVIGRHRGIGHYTVGQRRGLGISAPNPIYVTKLDVLHNTVVTGEADALLASSLMADRVSYLVPEPTGPFRASVKIRYLHQAAMATVTPLSQTAPQVERSDRTNRLTPLAPPLAREDESVDPLHENGQRSGDACTRGVRVDFDEPQRAITPGQAVVFYDGDVVLGGAWIDSAG